MSTASLRSSKTGSRSMRSPGAVRGNGSKKLRAKVSGKVAAYRHPAAFGEAVRKYAGIVRSASGDLSTREGFDD